MSCLQGVPLAALVCTIITCRHCLVVSRVLNQNQELELLTSLVLFRQILKCPYHDQQRSTRINLLNVRTYYTNITRIFSSSLHLSLSCQQTYFISPHFVIGSVILFSFVYIRFCSVVSPHTVGWQLSETRQSSLVASNYVKPSRILLEAN